MEQPLSTFESVLATVVGALLVGYAIRCWSGRNRRWARRQWSPELVLGVLPFFGPIVLGAGLYGLLGKPVGEALGVGLTAVAVVLTPPCLIYLMFHPRWWGPRWFRRLTPAQRRPDLGHPFTALLFALSAHARFSSARQAADAVEQAAPVSAEVRWRSGYVYDPTATERPHGLAPRGTVRGYLTLYPDAVTFAASRREDVLRGTPTVLVLPAAEIVDARVVRHGATADGVRQDNASWHSLLPRLVIETRPAADGRRQYLFDVSRAGTVAARISALAASAHQS